MLKEKVKGVTVFSLTYINLNYSSEELNNNA